MKRKIKTFSNIVAFSIIISLFNFPAYISLAVNKAYYNTQGQEFVRKLNEKRSESDIRKKVLYNLNFIYENKKINLENKLIYKNNRIYVSLKDIVNKLNSKEVVQDNNIIINDKVTIDVNEKSFKRKKNKIPLRGDLFVENGEYYISLFDLCEILNLTTFWNYDNDTIYIDNKIDKHIKTYKENKNDKKAYIRFEDFTAGDVYLSKGH